MLPRVVRLVSITPLAWTIGCALSDNVRETSASS